MLPTASSRKTFWGHCEHHSEAMRLVTPDIVDTALIYIHFNPLRESWPSSTSTRILDAFVKKVGITAH